MVFNDLLSVEQPCLVNPDRHGLRAVARVETDTTGTRIPLTGYELMRWFKLVTPDDDIEADVPNLFPKEIS